MVVPPMQIIGSNDDGTYASHIAPLTAGMLGLPCRPCLGLWQLKFGDYYQLVVPILGLGVIGMAHCHLRHYPIIYYRDFCT